jgi:pyridoxine kinase
MNILSIQSHVVSGHVGNAAAVFPLQRLGFEVMPINTVQFSNHVGYGQWTGQAFAPAHVDDLVEGLSQHGVLAGCAAVLSGYLGEPELAHSVIETARRVRAVSPDSVYLCDPVMGDRPGLYVKPEIPDLMRQAMVPAADVITPNAFELELLTGMPAVSCEQALAAARRLIADGRDGRPGIVVVTSVEAPEAHPGEIAVVAATADAAWQVVAPRFEVSSLVHGGGDAFSALFLGHYLRTRSLPAALERAASAVLALYRTCWSAGSTELPLVAAQEELVSPSVLVAAEPMG